MVPIAFFIALVFCKYGNTAVQANTINQTPVRISASKSVLCAFNGNYGSVGENEYEPSALESTPVIQQDCPPQKVVGNEFGQSATEASRHLVTDLSSPVTVGAKPRFELVQHRTELWETGLDITYQWTITDMASGKGVYRETTEQPVTRKIADTPGKYKIEVLVLANGIPTNIRIAMNQEVILEDSLLITFLNSYPAEHARAYKELIHNFKSYITEAANETGPYGISPRFLASILLLEIYHNSKENRVREVMFVEEAIRSLQKERWLFPWQTVDRSIGVGQIRLSTAAMMIGKTPWIDQQRWSRKQGRAQTEKNFVELPPDEKITLFRLLRWPKSNISMAARLLAKLKNRANRFPALTKNAFSANPHALSIIATEYNVGPSDSPAKDARTSWQGELITEYMNTDKILIHYFPDL